MPNTDSGKLKPSKDAEIIQVFERAMHRRGSSTERRSKEKLEDVQTVERMMISEFKRSGTQEFSNDKVPPLKKDNLFNEIQFPVMTVKEDSHL